MGTSSPKRSSIGTVIALLVTGFGIGWLAGLSVSPVVSIVITSVTGSVATIVAVLSGVKDELLDKDASPNTLRRFLRGITPVPLAWLVAGLIVGASVGIWIRTHSWLSPEQTINTPLSLEAEVAQWEALGLTRDEIVLALFNQRVVAKSIITTASENSDSTTGSTTSSSKDSVLFAVSQDECTEIIERSKSDSDAKFRQYLSVKSNWKKVEKVVADNALLKEVAAALCTKNG